MFTDFLRLIYRGETLVATVGRRASNMRTALLAIPLLFSTTIARAEQVKLTTELANPAVLAGKPNTTYLKIGLTGFAPASTGRAAVNLAIVLDRSSSMAGDKLVKAKEAAIMMLSRLDERDIVSVIAYSNSVEVLIPATKISDRDAIADRIRALDPRGRTALFAGVSKGAEEIRKFADKNRVNRIVLLSDGMANVGPSSPNELGQLGVACQKEGIAVTTIGLGLDYNEDLMAQLAQKSDGNHAFAETPDQLAQLFTAELGDVLSVVAQEVSVKVNLKNGARPIRALNRAAEIRGSTAILSLNQLYARQEKFLLLEVEVPAGKEASQVDVADVEVTYANVISGATDRLKSTAGVKFVGSQQLVDAVTKRDVMIGTIEAIANEQNRLAVTLRDEGKVDQAQKVLLDNSSYLRQNAARWSSPKLEEAGAKNEDDAKNLEEENWRRQRKTMRKSQYEAETQQSY